MQVITGFFQESPLIATVLLVITAFILWLLFAPQYTPKRDKDISNEEKEARIAEWCPKPIVPSTYNPTLQQIATPIIVKSDTGPIITSEDGIEYLSFTSGNYLGLASLPEIKNEAKETIKKYGVGSCGPRGFYGTIDLHLQLENTFAKFMGSEHAILYSDSLACVSSVIPAFAKAGDYIIVDSLSNYGIQQGMKLSRSKVSKFEHNDMKSLEERLKQNDETMAPHDKLKYRRFIIVEGIYNKTGAVCPLDQVVKLAQKYKFRVILDDSNAIGVLGKTGRGSLEHWGLTLKDVQIVCATLDNTLSSVGGICIGSKQVVSHQRLSGAGYCFSAASPPYTARVASYAIGLIDSNPQLITAIQEKCSFAHQECMTKLQGIGFDVLGHINSPVIVLRPSSSHYKKWLFNPQTKSNTTRTPIPYNKVQGTDIEIYQKLKQIAQILRDEYHILISVQHHALQEELYPYGLKLQITILHSDDDIKLAVDILVKVTTKVLDSVGNDNNNNNNCELPQ